MFAKVAGRVVARPLRRLAVRGRSAQIMLYELVGISDSADPELQTSERELQMCRMTEAAADAFLSGRVADAIQRYDNLVVAFPDDPVARHLRDWVTADPQSRSPMRERMS